MPTEAEIERRLEHLSRRQGPLPIWPESHGEVEQDVLKLSSTIYLQGYHAPRSRMELRRVLGEANYHRLICLIAYVKTCHAWMEAHPEVSYAQDLRAMNHLPPLSREEPRLLEFFRSYLPRFTQQRQDQLVAEVSERKRLEQERVQLILRERTARDEAEVGARRVALLAEVSLAVSASLDYSSILEEVTRRTVPTFADACIIDLIEPGEMLEQVAAHLDATKNATLEALAPRALDTLDASSVESQVQEGGGPLLRTGAAVWVPEVTGVPVRALLVVALEVRGRRFGMLRFLSLGDECSFTPADVALAEEIARRVAMSIEGGRLFAAEQRARQAAERAADLEKKLLGIVGHDIRSPLASIVATTSLLLQRQELSAPQVRSVQRISRCSARIDELIHSLLDFTRARLGGGIPLVSSPTRLGDIWQRVLEEFEWSHPHRAIEYTHEGPGEGEWDGSRLAQVVANLVDNAMKYGRVDRPIRVHVHDEGSEGTLLEVHNEGNPIAPELVEQLFEPFRRGYRTDETVKHSLGLGLYIVKEVVTAHGGSVEVLSNSIEGTTFRVRLPRSARITGSASAPEPTLSFTE